MKAYRGLNTRQEEAVLHGTGPLLILAGAGTGKTRTIACRIARLVGDGVPSESILAVAFTNKSAGELRTRVQGLLRKGARAPLVSTFHSFCVRVLRRDIERLGYKRNFTIYDTTDQLAVIREGARELKLAGRDLDAKRLLWIISRAKNGGAVPDPGDGTDEYRIYASQLYSLYGEALRAYNAVDFDDLLLLTLRLFDRHPEVLAHWKDRVRYVLVDEFQDTNAVQYEMVSLLAAPEGNITVVGDDDQSIYGWRGAVPDNIHDFASDWPGVRIITLNQNYRSSEGILEAANSVICRNNGRRPKELWSTLGRGEPVRAFRCATGEDEAETVVGEIVSHVAAGRGRAGDWAVMYRTNAQSRLFEDALRRERIRYVVVGGMRFYDRKEVRDFLAYLSCAFNTRDEISLLRILNYPARGIGRETVRRLQQSSLGSGDPLAKVMEQAQALPGVGSRQAREISRFLELLGRARSRLVPGRLSEAARWLSEILDLEGEVLRSTKDPETGWRKAENIREVVAALASFEQQNPAAGLGEYLAGVNLSGKEEETDQHSKAVTLLTVHAAKGLEFPHVFLVGMEEGLFPHERSCDSPLGLEEERRLAYVGMTRAKKTLTLTWAASRSRRSGDLKCLPSRFLTELPSEGIVKRGYGGAESGGDPSEESRIGKAFLKRINGRL